MHTLLEGVAGSRRDLAEERLGFVDSVREDVNGLHLCGWLAPGGAPVDAIELTLRARRGGTTVYDCRIRHDSGLAWIPAEDKAFPRRSGVAEI